MFNIVLAQTLTERKIHYLQRTFHFCSGKLHVRMKGYLKGISSLSNISLIFSIHLFFFFSSHLWTFSGFSNHWSKGNHSPYSCLVIQLRRIARILFPFLALTPAVPGRMLIKTSFQALLACVQKNTRGWTVTFLNSREEQINLSYIS